MAKCCEGVLWRCVMVKCCRGVVEKCCEKMHKEVLERSFVGGVVAKYCGVVS